jgi:hypothetical protein
MEFLQATIGQILDSEKEMVLRASERFGKYYETALECSLLMTHFLNETDPDRWVFAAFLSQVKKHHTLALFSAVRLHKVQAMMVLRQALEAGACAAFAIANPDPAQFVDADESGILDPSQKLAKKRYNWLAENYPEGSSAIKEIKKQINTSDAHANLINTFLTDDGAGLFVTPFFDIEDEDYVKTHLWQIGHVALTLLHLFYEINERRNVIKFVGNFWPQIQTLGQKNESLRAEMMASDRVKRAMQKEAGRRAATKAD